MINDIGETEEQWTGNYLFEDEWQSFRTKKIQPWSLPASHMNINNRVNIK